MIFATMKKFLVSLFLFPLFTAAQTDTIRPPYLRYQELPPIHLLLADSVTKFTKSDLPEKKPVLLMLFSPDCSHCQNTAIEIGKYRKELNDIRIVMVTMHPVSQMREFISKYQLDRVPEVVVGKDIYYFMIPFYNIKNLPYMAFYNKKGRLISVFEGAMSIPGIIELFKKNK